MSGKAYLSYTCEHVDNCEKWVKKNYMESAAISVVVNEIDVQCVSLVYHGYARPDMCIYIMFIYYKLSPKD